MMETGFFMGAAILFAVAGIITLVVRRRRIPLIEERDIPWAIGLYTGASPVALAPAEGVQNPALCATDVTDVDARFVADPFMIQSADTWYMFLEVLNAAKRKGEIAYATSKDAINWEYQQVVLNELFHLSYPYVFTWEGAHYMVPESCRSGGIRLYKADEFPAKWRFLGNIMEDVDYVDASIFRHDGKWWLFTTRSYPNSSSLYLYHSNELMGPWIQHPKSPVVESDLRKARPAGRVLVTGDSIVRYAQDLEGGYGLGVRAFEITHLTETDYEERPLAEGQPIIAPTGRGWNGVGMHHIDAHQTAGGQWLALVDGRGKERVFGSARPRTTDMTRNTPSKTQVPCNAPRVSKS